MTGGSLGTGSFPAVIRYDCLDWVDRKCARLELPIRGEPKVYCFRNNVSQSVEKGDENVKTRTWVWITTYELYHLLQVWVLHPQLSGRQGRNRRPERVTRDYYTVLRILFGRMNDVPDQDVADLRPGIPEALVHTALIAPAGRFHSRLQVGLPVRPRF